MLPTRDWRQGLLRNPGLNEVPLFLFKKMEFAGPPPAACTALRSPSRFWNYSS